MNKKGNAVAIVAIVLALIILIMFLVNIGSRECTNNNDCSDNQYCGTDYECHDFPGQIFVEKNNYVWPAVIMGISLIAAAWIFKRKAA